MKKFISYVDEEGINFVKTNDISSVETNDDGVIITMSNAEVFRIDANDEDRKSDIVSSILSMMDIEQEQIGVIQ